MNREEYNSAVSAIVVDIVHQIDAIGGGFGGPMGRTHLQDMAYAMVQACTLMANPANHAAIIGHHPSSAALCRRYWDCVPASDIPSNDVTLAVTMAKHMKAIATMAMALDVADTVDALVGCEP